MGLLWVNFWVPKFFFEIRNLFFNLWPKHFLGLKNFGAIYIPKYIELFGIPSNFVCHPKPSGTQSKQPGLILVQKHFLHSRITILYTYNQLTHWLTYYLTFSDGYHFKCREIMSFLFECYPKKKWLLGWNNNNLGHLANRILTCRISTLLFGMKLIVYLSCSESLSQLD